MEHQYLYVPYEERSEVEKRGGHWDGNTKRWYLTAQDDPTPFKRWLTPNGGDEPGEKRYPIESEQAFVACAKTFCHDCGATDIDVIAIYCATGLLQGEPFDDFSVMHISAADEALTRQLAPWPFFRKDNSVFCNYCPHCQAPQADMELHCEPDGVFFHMDPASREKMTMTPLAGHVRLSGEETFEV